jgi:uncharacterized SAM-binding protein YcdF (DUF218 family)
MVFILSKTAAFLLLPSNFLIALCLIGFALMTTRFKRAGLRVAIGSVVLLALLGYSPAGSLLSHKLENRFPPWDASRGAPDGIIVLGGGINAALSRAHGETILNRDGGRVVAIAKLARAYPNARIVYSGGNASLFTDQPPETDYLYPVLDYFGVPRERVMLESKSRNTTENAIFTKELMRPKPGERWLLVTSAQHMPRAVGCFRQAGFPVEAYPVSWRAGRRVRFYVSDSFGAGLNRLDLAVHEWLGLIVYRMLGRIGELLPGPAATP